MKNKMSTEGFVSLIKKRSCCHFDTFDASLLTCSKVLFGKSVGLVGE